MEPNMILAFIKQKGYNTKEEIEEQFSDHNVEIVNMQLEYLVEKKILGKSTYASEVGHGTLYYVIYRKES